MLYFRADMKIVFVYTYRDGVFPILHILYNAKRDPFHNCCVDEKVYARMK